MPKDLLSEAYFLQALTTWENARREEFRLLGVSLQEGGFLDSDLSARWQQVECHPLFHRILDLLERQPSPPCLALAIESLREVPSIWKGEPPETTQVDQNPALIPSIVCSQTSCLISPISEIQELQEHLNVSIHEIRLIDSNISWFITRALRVVTFIVPLRRDSYFSGSSWELFGAAHLSRNLNLHAIAEMLVHEAEHTRLHLLELSTPFLGAACDMQEKYYSPWRPDPRPLYGILHGVHVFSAVTALLARGLCKDAFREQTSLALSRLALICAQSYRAIDELQEHACLTSFGEDVVQFARGRISVAAHCLDRQLFERAMQDVVKVERQRRERWACDYS
jgi:hypothetical protein